MAHFLLVHGAAHGAWCWRDLIPQLAALGHEARAIDLPGHGSDSTPIDTVTLQDYADAVRAALDTPSIVVGHSMGGYPITLAAETDPRHISRLVYLCAYTPWPGLSLAQMRHEAEEQPLLPLIRRAANGKSFTFDTSKGTDAFYHDVPPETVAEAIARLCPESTAASATAIQITARSQDLPRDYITCLEDRAIPPAFQKVMAARFPEANRHALPSSHSPFFSMPGRLAALLDRIAKTTTD